MTMLKKRNKVGMIGQIKTNHYTSSQSVLLLQSLFNAGNGRISINITFNHQGVATEQ